MSVHSLTPQKPQTFVVTGGNAGIGKAIALALAHQQRHVVIVSRDRARGEAAVAEIRAQSGNVAVECVQGDVSTLATTQDLADRLLAYPQLTVLINNAGVWASTRVVTSDGFELSFMVNHLAPFLLSRRLVPRLQANAPARIVNVSAGLYPLGRVDTARTPYGTDFRRIGTYASTKLWSLLGMQILAEQLNGTGVTVNAVHPGVIRTNLGAMPGLLGKLLALVKRGWGTPEQGARAPVWLATDPAVAAVNGRFFEGCTPASWKGAARDRASAHQVWDVSVALADAGSSPGGRSYAS